MFLGDCTHIHKKMNFMVLYQQNRVWQALAKRMFYHREPVIETVP